MFVADSLNLIGTQKQHFLFIVKYNFVLPKNGKLFAYTSLQVTLKDRAGNLFTLHK